MRGGGSTPLCSRTLHVQRSRLFIAVPVRDAYLSGCDGNRTRYGLLAKPWPVDLRPHPTILFWLGNHRPRDGRTDALLLAWYQRFSGCTPRAVTCSFCGRLSHRPPTERALKLSGGFLRRRSKKHASPPSKGEKEVNLFNDASVQKKHH